jgi:hypothetical protein
MTYPISKQHRQQENKSSHIFCTTIITLIFPQRHGRINKNIRCHTTNTGKKWAKFTYSGKETRFITKIIIIKNLAYTLHLPLDKP